MAGSCAPYPSPLRPPVPPLISDHLRPPHSLLKEWQSYRDPVRGWEAGGSALAGWIGIGGEQRGGPSQHHCGRPTHNLAAEPPRAQPPSALAGRVGQATCPGFVGRSRRGTFARAKRGGRGDGGGPSTGSSTRDRHIAGGRGGR